MVGMKSETPLPTRHRGALIWPLFSDLELGDGVTRFCLHTLLAASFSSRLCLWVWNLKTGCGSFSKKKKRRSKKAGKMTQQENGVYVGLFIR